MNEADELRERLRAVYSETTTDHVLHPRNSEEIPNPDGFAACRSGCNEVMKIWLRVRNETIIDTAFWTNGCAATIACGSMATELVKDKSVREALALAAEDIAQALVNLPEGNLHCAELAAGTLRAALQNSLETQQQPWKKLYRR
jgi:nitrogen fixation protein NifU and related proteins